MARRKKTIFGRTLRKRKNKILTESRTDIKHVPNEKQYLECATTEQKIDVFEPEQLQVTIESGDDYKKEVDESGSDTLSQNPVNEELWVVRRQLCRGCHSDGNFWSLQTTTEGDTYGDLLQRYFNIQLCPVSNDELALSAICALCAARLREVRAFSAQARIAEERFTRLYKQNRFRALVNEVEVKIDGPKIKNEVNDFETTDDVEPDAGASNLDKPELSIDILAPTLNKSKKIQERRHKASLVTEVEVKDGPKIRNEEVDDFEITDDGEPDTAMSNLDNPEPSIDELARTLNKKKKTQERRHEPLFRLLPSDYERVGNLFKCTRCNKLYRKGMIHAHVKHTHLKLPRQKFICTHCNKTFYDRSPFTKHKLEEHSIDDRIKCNACDWFTYRTKAYLTKHKNEFHMLGEKLTCPDCDYICFHKRAMTRHAVKHSTVKEHHCKFCKKSFLRKNNLSYHERIHTGDKRQVCNVCEQAFVQRASLTYHMAKHHPEVRF